MPEHRIRVVIADDHPAISLGILYELGKNPALEVVGRASNSTELFACIERCECDVIVVDYTMPGGKYGDGISMLSHIRRHFPSLKIVLYTMMDNPGLIRAIVKKGVTCIVSKSDATNHLLPAVSAAFSWSQYFSPLIKEILLDKLLFGDDGQLTTRESEIVRLFGEGLTITEIAERSHRSVQTISTQKARAMKKLGIKRDADLIRYASESN
ncbi:MAG: Transcriptional regulatory protein RcsB [Pseudomonas sp.]|nr:MAG: Transcriptional regulatory protein RcsB [Pseudomonas sp.]